MNYPKHFNVFYSWQSDIHNKANNHFIKDCIEKAIKDLNKEKEITVIPRLDKDTQGLSGSPNITDAILTKIDASHLFISDVTIINASWLNKNILKHRLTPNPNVLFELGYALNRLSWDRIICLNNKAFSNIIDLPFDLKQNRISQYTFDGKNNKEQTKKELTELLKNAIKNIIDNNDVIVAKQQQQNIYQHDIRVFETLNDIVDDQGLLQLLDYIGNNQMIYKDEFRILEKTHEYLKAEKNQFLVSEINEKSTELQSVLIGLVVILGKNFVSKTETWFDEEEQVMKEDTLYYLTKDQRGFDSYQEFEKIRDKKMHQNEDAVDKTIETYKLFRASIKKNLYI